jgi:hypothetical protein
VGDDTTYRAVAEPRRDDGGEGDWSALARLAEPVLAAERAPVAAEQGGVRNGSGVGNLISLAPL